MRFIQIIKKTRTQWILLAVLALACSPGKDGSVFSKIELKELDGTTIDLDQYKGKTVFLNIWATWCGPCVKEMPSIEKAQQAIGDDSVVFLLASDESQERINGFIQSKKYNLKFVQISSLDPLNVQALPTTIIISKAGDVAFSEIGARQWDDASNLDLIRKIAAQ